MSVADPSVAALLKLSLAVISLGSALKSAYNGWIRETWRLIKALKNLPRQMEEIMVLLEKIRAILIALLDDKPTDNEEMLQDLRDDDGPRPGDYWADGGPEARERERLEQ